MNPKQIDSISTVEDVEKLAAEHGISLKKSDYNIAQGVRETYMQRLQESETDEEIVSEAWLDRFMRWYPKMLDAIASAGNILMTLSQSVIANLGVPIVLVALLIVEQQRVLHGMQLFETEESLAHFGAWALVISNLLLEIVAHHVEYTHMYEPERRRRWSLRIWANNMRYRLGWGEAWAEQELSPAQWAHTLLGLVTFTILALALAGSMKTVIQGINGAWYTALTTIIVSSSLLEMMTWLGGLLFAAAAVLIAQGLSRYVAHRTVEIRAAMNQQSDEMKQEAEAAAAR
ncbi:MAG: hypothetical protein KC496_15360, partial [Anaerolineae bacterium]|nr:hypothetical protein [Anaerolineae bacterium]